MSNFDRRKFLKTVTAATALGMVSGCAKTNSRMDLTHQSPSVMGLTIPKMDVVRVAFIGVGQRGSGHVKHFCRLEGVEIRAICDTHEKMLDESIQYVMDQGLAKPKRYTGSDYVYRDMLEQQDIDIVIISTPWKWHTLMCVDTMESGKHAFVEVPAATTVEECWLLVDTAEKTQKNCMMMENVCYGRNELMVLNMVRQGLFGELLHGEAAYIHELRWQMKEIEHSTGSWRTHWHTKVDGNLYPTHGLGPVSQYMNINRGDRFDYVTSSSSPAIGRQAYAQKEFPANHSRNSLKYIAGDMNTSLIKTALGRTIMLQHDTTTPRPYSRHNLIQGTNGAFAGFPDRIALETLPDSLQQHYQEQYQQALINWEKSGQQGSKPREYSYHQWDYEMAPWQSEFEHPLWVRMGEEAQKNGGHGGMDFLMLWRMIYCLRNGEALDQDVYDAAAWSAITPLSAASVSDRSNSKDVPDFTRGKWKTAKPLSIIS